MAMARAVPVASQIGGRERACPRGPVSPACSWAAMPASSNARSSPWTSSSVPTAAAARSSSRQQRLVHAEVVDQEALAAADAQLGDGGQIGDGIHLLSGDDRRQADIDGRVAARPVEPLRERRPAAMAATGALIPVPGLLKASIVVVPPNAAATVSLKNRSGSSSDAIRVWVWTSMTPGRTSIPLASMTTRRGCRRDARLDGHDASVHGRPRPRRASRPPGPRCRPAPGGRTGVSARCSSGLVDLLDAAAPGHPPRDTAGPAHGAGRGRVTRVAK